MGTIARMSKPKQVWAETLGAHERAHVKIIASVLGPKAGPKPSFDFGNATETDADFTRTAVAMEDLTVALLTGVTPRLHDRRLTAALFGLLTVEARHASWARHIVGATPAPAAFDEPRTLDSVTGAIRRTHFIAGAAEDDLVELAELHGLMRRRAALAGALAGAAIATAAAAVALPGSGPAGVEPGAERAARTLPAPVVPAFRPGAPHGLGSRRDLAHWAPVRRATLARAAPDPAAAVVAAVSATTPEGTDNARRRARAPCRRERRALGPRPARRAPQRHAPAGSRVRRSAATRPSTRASTSTSSTCA